VVWTKHAADAAGIDGSQVVFVGYGVEAPEFGWDDYKGVDTKGKTLLMLVNDPPVPDPTNPNQLDPKVFGGKTMTYYGRWTYKYEEGARRGASAVILIHETGPAGYPFSVVQGKTAEQFDLVTPDNMGRAELEGWITLDKAKALFKLAGQDLDALKQRAATREFRPMPLGVTASMTIANKLRTIDSTNVVARLPGSDPALRGEYVVYTAHWDHFGVGRPVNGDAIYNGALDNASGTAGLLEVARAFTLAKPPPRRSILFLFVTAEEQGLLGSQAYVKDHFGSFEDPKPEYANFAGYFNIDSGTGRARGMTVFGPPAAATILREALAPFADNGVMGAAATRSRRRGVPPSTWLNTGSSVQLRARTSRASR